MKRVQKIIFNYCIIYAKSIVYVSEGGTMGGQENIKKKKKIKIRYIILILICIIVAAAAVITIWQWDNIKALRYALGTSEEELEQEMAATQQELDDAAKEYNVPEIDLTDEELAALESGDMDLNSVVDRVLAAAGTSSGASGSSDGSGGQGASGSGDTGNAGDDGSGTGDGGNTSAGQDAEVQRLITSLYVLRSSYSSRLSGLVSSAKSEFAALPAEQQTDTARRRIVASKISEASSLESSCDAQVNSIYQQLKSRLSELGQSTSAADRILSAYQQEKTLAKAQYMSQLG